MSSRIYDVSAEDFVSGFGTDFAASMPALPGDFYCELDDVVRGVTLPLGDAMGFSDSCAGSKAHMLGCASNSGNEFEESDAPPPLTEEMKAYLELTTLRLSEYSAVKVANQLLTFLAQVVDARVHKVNHKKFTIRAEVVLDDFHCDLKVRIYQQVQTSIVEFQRRSGDTVAFNKFFRQASAYLQGHAFYGASSPPPIPRMITLPPDQAIAPLLDMTHPCQDLAILAEVAAVLAVLAKDPKVAAQLRTACASSALQQLQRVHDFSVACPTSQLLSCI